ncbi:MAG: hypothetical protein J5J00_08075 [Deltaproteobacteria bacterium]|nr:hypothetical protein [Deltaproteobacteria bacterium]
MLGFLKKILRVKLEELEAKLLPTQQCSFGGAGEIEVKSYSDGSVMLELSLKHTGIASGQKAEFYCSGELVGSAIVQNGYAKNFIRLEPGARKPMMTVGSTAEIRVGGTILYCGTFRPD